MRNEDSKRKYDPMAPENLPKGMRLTSVKATSQLDQNYVAEIVKKLKEISSFDVEVLRIETAEGVDQNLTLSLILEVSSKGEDGV